ncbi:MAG TPA: hypothetical protein VM661_03400 [Candidatus Sulfotelmatobacter sp.]|jgi:hypothetical protein|nr:hypothetical protein [Candidatus Sulfotelmatobacter sp.]
MVNQYESMLKLQIAAWEGWVKLWKDGFTAYETLVAHQGKLLQHPSYLRFQDFIPSGASLLDHYGKRSHDVDVERV